MELAGKYPKVAAQLNDEDLARRLAAIEAGDLETTESSVTSKSRKFVAKGIVDDLIERWHGTPPLWKSNAHAFGYVLDSKDGAETIDIKDAGDVPADLSLKGSRINLTLNIIRAAEYPGSGTHHILFDFYARNQTSEGTEEVHFNAVHRVLDGQRAGIRGLPIFIGLGVGTEGLSLRCYTVNVKNDDDEKLLAILDSEAFKNGLRLVNSLQPAITPLTSMVIGLTKVLAARDRNIPVQDINIGLDFNSTPGGMRLAEGAYVLIQIPENDRLIWDWSDWVFHRASGQIVNRADHGKLIPFNYLVIGISKYAGT